MLSRRTFLQASAAIVAAGATGSARDSGTVTLRFAAGEAAGTYIQFAHLLAAATAGSTMRIDPLITDGSRTNIRLLRNGDAELALTHADAIGEDMEAGALAAIGRVYENYIQVAVRDDSDFTDLSDLRGGRIVLGAPGSGVAAVTSLRILDAAAMTNTVEALTMPLAESIAALQQREIDAVIWGSGFPTPALHTAGVRYLSLGAVIPGLQRRHPGMYDHVRLPGTSVDTVGVANLLLTRTDLPDALAAQLSEVLVRKASELIPEHALGTQFLDVRSLIGTRPVPLHPGAAESYRRLHG